jgi:large subunit ribosomal protein L13
MKTSFPKNSDKDRTWHLVDADGKTLGRLSVQIANLLRGRGKPIFARHIDNGDFVVVINARKVKLTGRKDELKKYTNFTGYRGGQYDIPLAMVRERHPDRIITHAVKGMMPRTHLSRTILKRLKVYAGTEHHHAAQKPVPVDLTKKGV